MIKINLAIEDMDLSFSDKMIVFNSFSLYIYDNFMDFRGKPIIRENKKE